MPSEQMFKIIESANPREVEALVSNHIHSGWQLHGELQIITHDDLAVKVVYVQAIVRYGIALGYD